MFHDRSAHSSSALDSKARSAIGLPQIALGKAGIFVIIPAKLQQFTPFDQRCLLCSSTKRPKLAICEEAELTFATDC
jgi:hypothetical protein